MTYPELKQLVHLFDTSTASVMRLHQGDFSLELERTTAVQAPPVPTTVCPPIVEAPAITAPLVGTFYTASAPGKAPFVSPGQTVRQGESVCLIEAMKMMSEVVAPCDCIIREICQENGTLLSFGDVLFRYDKV